MKEFLKQLAQRNQFLKKESIDIYIDRVSYFGLLRIKAFMKYNKNYESYDYGWNYSSLPLYPINCYLAFYLKLKVKPLFAQFHQMLSCGLVKGAK